MTTKHEFLRIEQLKKEWESLHPLTTEHAERLKKKLRLEWNYNSNHIEGNTLTYGQTALLLIYDQSSGDINVREIEEMKAHDVAINMVQIEAEDKQRPLTENFIRKLNEVLLVRPFWKEAVTESNQPTRREIIPGEYKSFPNSVRLQNGEVFHYARPEETAALMNDLINWYRQNVESLHPVELAALLHYKFVRIHPFDDGNGRVARLLMNYVLIREGYLPAIIPSKDKSQYLMALNKADVGDLGAFVLYISEQCAKSLQLGIKAAKGESIEEPDDIDKEIALWKSEFEGEEAKALPKSDLVIVELYQKGIRPFLELYINKVKQFEDLFDSIELRSYFNNTSNLTMWSEELDNKIEKVSMGLNNIETEGITKGDNTISNLKIYVQLNGFKKNGTNAFSLSERLEVQFLQYTYEVKFNHNQVHEFLYSEPISSDAARKMVSEAIKSTFETIKSRVKQ